MSSVRSHISRIIAIVPHSKGLGYAVFEGIKRPIDWGIKRVTGEKNAASLQKVEALIEVYRPDAIVLEEVDGSRRCERVKVLIALIKKRSRDLGIEVVSFSRLVVGKIVAPKCRLTKYQMACRIADRFPALHPRLPAPRLPWQSEDYRMSIFEACGLCLAWFGTREHDHPAAA